MVTPLPAYARLLKLPARSFFLFGMRGVGKSTWARQALPEATRFDLLDEGLYQSYLRDPGLFGRELARVPAKHWVIVDEVQRLPNLLNDVHRFIEERHLRFALLGSSARKLKHAGVNLLAGRALSRVMLPLLPEELGEDFDLDRILTSGSVAVILQSEAPEESLRAYVQMYLKQEIQAEALVRNLPGFARFLPIAALFHGQVLNTAGLARDAGVARTTVAGYLDILADTQLAWLLPAFEARLRVKERQHPKLYWVDPGVVRAARGEFHPPAAAGARAAPRGLGGDVAEGLWRSDNRSRQPVRLARVLGAVEQQRRSGLHPAATASVDGHRGEGKDNAVVARLHRPEGNRRARQSVTPDSRLPRGEALPHGRRDRCTAGAGDS